MIIKQSSFHRIVYFLKALSILLSLTLSRGSILKQTDRSSVAMSSLSPKTFVQIHFLTKVFVHLSQSYYVRALILAKVLTLDEQKHCEKSVLGQVHWGWNLYH